MDYWHDIELVSDDNIEIKLSQESFSDYQKYTTQKISQMLQEQYMTLKEDLDECNLKLFPAKK